MNSTVILVTLVVYKLTLVGIGLWASRRTHDETDFLLGGRALGPWVAGLSYAASTSSAWVLLGFSGFVFVNGLSALWMVPGILLGYVVVWLWFGPRLRADSRARNHVTLTDYLAAGAGPVARWAIAILASAFILFCFIFYIAAQFQAAGESFATTFNLGQTESVLIGAVVILVYALLGGFWAVSVTDALQAMIMALIAIILPVTAVMAAGGFAGVFDAIAAAPSTPEGYLSFDGGRAPHLFIGFALGIFSIGLGTLGQPHLLARLMAVRDERARRAGFIIAITWALIIYAGMSSLALAGRALHPELDANETIFHVMTQSVLPPVLAGVVLAAVLSAVMSTVDSILLAAAGAVSHDLGAARRWRAHELLVARLVMAAICVLAIVMTLSVPATIFGRVLFAWSALGAAFGPIVAARVAGRDPAPWARIAAMATGFALTVAFNQFLPSGPGQIGERLLPWLPALAIVFAFSRPARRPGSNLNGSGA